MNGDERKRLWEFALHEDELFSQRQNLFLIAQSMLVVAYATALDAKQDGVALAIAIIALPLTAMWLYVSARHSLVISTIQDRAKNAFSEYRLLYAARSWKWVPFRSRTVVAYWVPGLVAVLWIVLLAFRF
jgi:hypothetical protein